MLYMSRTVLVHHQEQLYKLYIAYVGICRYVWLLCGYSHTTATRIGIYRYMRCTAYKVAPDDGLIQSETCRASNGKYSLITRILCILLVYTHIIILCFDLSLCTEIN